MRRNAIRPRSAGWTIAEAMAALAVVGIGLTASFHVFYHGRDLDMAAEQAALRSRAAQSMMERTLVLPYDRIVSHSEPLRPERAGGYTGWTAAVRTRPAGRDLKEVHVLVSGAGGRAELRILVSRTGRSR